MDEEASQRSESSSSSFSSSESGMPCPICLGPFVEESYLDACLHEFCFDCIARWIKVTSTNHSLPPSVKCPLCKIESFSIIYGFNGRSPRRHYVSIDSKDSFILSEAHKYRLQRYYAHLGSMDDIAIVLKYWKLHRHLQPNRWLPTWLTREIQALLEEEDVSIIVHHIMGMIDSLLRRIRSDTCGRRNHEQEREEFEHIMDEAARPFLGPRTWKFVNELELFLALGLNVDAYDQVIYAQNLCYEHV